MNWTDWLLHIFFPKRCAYCGRVIEVNDTACERCLPQLPRMEEPVCYRCGRTRKLCTCKAHRRAFDRAVCAMRYEAEVRQAVLALKDNAYADAVAAMAQEMVAVLRTRIDAAALDVVTAVPMYKTERRRRGYNQSEMLAKAVAKELGVAYEPLLVKVFPTASQKSLPMIERSGNLLGAFDAVRRVDEQRILLVDDLITTGSTMHEAAKMLKLYGAASVTALSFAGTVPGEDEDE